MITAYQFKLKLTEEQRSYVIRSLGCVRKVWNHFLGKSNEDKYTSYKEIASELIELKQELDYLRECPSQSLQQTLRNLDRAFKGFFKGKSEYPVFKKKYKKQSLHFPQYIKILGKGKVFLPKLKEVNFIQHRDIPNDFKVSNAYITLKADGFYLSLQGERDVEIPQKSLRKIIAFDIGIKHFLTSHQKEYITSLNKYEQNLEKIQKLSKELSLKTKNSNSWTKQKNKLAKLHQHVANCRKDFLHKLSHKFANEYDIVVMEKLDIQNMLQNGSRKLNRQILDQGWYMFKVFLKYKLERQGKKLIEVNPTYTSQTCSYCGHISRSNRKSQASFCCQRCGLTLNADYNASLNILKRGINQLTSMEQARVWNEVFKKATFLSEAQVFKALDLSSSL